jgi:hypothetical protein
MPTYFAGTAQITFPNLNGGTVFNREDQFGDVLIAPTPGRFALQANSSEFPVSYIQTGVDITLEFSIVDISRKFDLLAVAYGGAKVTGSGKTKYIFTDRAGEAVTGHVVLIKPYVGNAVSSSANDWVTFHNAVVAETPDTNLAYGMSTQQVIRFRMRALADVATGNKVTVGDTTAV